MKPILAASYLTAIIVTVSEIRVFLFDLYSRLFLEPVHPRKYSLQIQSDWILCLQMVMKWLIHCGMLNLLVKPTMLR